LIFFGRFPSGLEAKNLVLGWIFGISCKKTPMRLKKINKFFEIIHDIANGVLYGGLKILGCLVNLQVGTYVTHK
jgi:hypothetical protein